MSDADNISNSELALGPRQHAKASGRPGKVRKIIMIGVIGVVAALPVSYALIKLRVFRAPYPRAMKALSWKIGCQDEAYNLAEVVPGKVFRSSRPDEKVFRYAYQKGVRRIITLDGGDMESNKPGRGIEDPPADLADLQRMIFYWDSESPPPHDQLMQVLDMFDSGPPVLVHCWAGIDRTGYAIAAYRILRQDWPLDKALAEMNSFGHRSRGAKASLQADLRALYAQRHASPVAATTKPAASTP